MENLQNILANDYCGIDNFLKLRRIDQRYQAGDKSQRDQTTGDDDHHPLQG